MAKEGAPYMPWYGREFYADENIQVMTLEQEGSYLRLIWNCWQEGSIPADTAKLAAVCKNMPVRKFDRDIWPALRDLFSSGDDGRLTHHKVEMLRDAKEARRVACSKGGKLGNELRWGKDRVPDAEATEMRPEPDHSKSLTEYRVPSTEYRIQEKTLNPCASGDARVGADLPSIDNPPFGTTEPEALFTVEPKKPAKSVNGLTPQQEIWFSEFWAGYWLHRSRKSTRQAFGRQVKTVARFAQVMAAMQAQTAEMLSREAPHRPHGATWLHQERWDDETPKDGPVKRTECNEALDTMYAAMQREQGEMTV